MLSASFYIIVCSAKNRIRKRLQRLREPRYLVGAIVGGAYLYFSFFARSRSRAAAARRGRQRSAPFSTEAVVAAAAPLAGVALLVLATLAWVLPFDSGLLEFSDAETAILFPAPVTRRELLVHRLLRSQLGILFGSLVVGMASPVAGWARVRTSLAFWVLFVTFRVYYTAVTLVRSRTREGSAAIPRAWAPFAACLAALTIVVVSMARAWSSAPVQDAGDAFARLASAAGRGAAGVVLLPFVALARPLFAPDARAFGAAMVGAVAVLTLCIVWMLRSDAAFQEAAANAAARRAERAQSRRAPIRARATGLTLASTGRPELAFFWKNAVQTLRLTGVTAIRIAVACLVIVLAVTSMVVNALHLRSGAAAACGVAMAVAVFTAILGPQIVRTDMRTDLLHLELLKTWPVRPGAIIRGEIAWPASILTLLGWAAVASAAAFSPAAFPRIPSVTRAAFAAAAVLLMPALVLAQYLVQNAAALAFPAWVPLGNQRPRGVDAMGQRLIMLGGALLSVAVLMLPGALAGGAVWFALDRWIGSMALVPAAAVCAAIVLVEVLATTELLGPLYERLDVLSVERTE